MVRYILYIVLLVIAYQFIFNLVIPIYSATRKIKKGFREMHTRMQDQTNTQTHTQTPKSSPTPQPKEHAGEYIDFEEL